MYYLNITSCINIQHCHVCMSILKGVKASQYGKIIFEVALGFSLAPMISRDFPKKFASKKHWKF